MSFSRSPGPPTDPDYLDIEAALAATARGRAFLAEHARRERAASTQALLDAVARLEKRVGNGTAGTSRVRELVDAMSDITRAALADLADRSSGGSAEAAAALGHRAADATNAISDAAEDVQDWAWTLRERGFDPRLCDELDDRAAAVALACQAGRAVLEQSRTLAETFAALEGRMGELRRLCGLNRDDDQLDGRGEGEPAPASPAIDELARFAALPTREQLRLLT